LSAWENGWNTIEKYGRPGNRRTTVKNTAGILCFVLFMACSAMANEDYVFAKLISEDKLRYPSSARFNSWEGWAYYTYKIDTDGTVFDIEILDSNGIGPLNDALVNHLQSRQYEPATLDGQPVVQANEVGRATFVLRGKPRSAGRKFYRTYTRARDAIAEGRLEEAQQLLEKLRQTKQRSLYEEVYLHSLYTAYFNATGDKDRAYVHALRVLDFYDDEASYWTKLAEDRFFFVFLAKAYEYEVDGMMLGNALLTAHELARHYPDNDKTTLVQDHAEKIMAQVADTPHALTARIPRPVYGGNKGVLNLRLLKNEIGIADVSAGLDSLMLYCQHGFRDLDFFASDAWIIPAGWAPCSLSARGDTNASFVLTEYPDGSLEPATP
jgi:TonB family protein